jgi:hypothetical protein
MEEALKEANSQVVALPEAKQEELAQTILPVAARRRIDAELAASEAAGGEIPQDEVFRELLRPH